MIVCCSKQTQHVRAASFKDEQLEQHPLRLKNCSTAASAYAAAVLSQDSTNRLCIVQLHDILCVLRWRSTAGVTIADTIIVSHKLVV
jgi:hypothetical protein